MKRSFSASTTSKPEGMLRAVRFPQLAMMNTETGDGRLLEGEGGGVRDLPRTIFAQFAQAGGHMGSVPVGRLDEVTLDDDNNIVSGSGWLVDMPHVRDVFVPLIASGSLRHNSVDLADVTAIIKWKSDDPNDPDFWEYTITFTKWNIAATTLVGVPAFADARVELEELVASMPAVQSIMAGDEPLDWIIDQTDIRVEGIDFAFNDAGEIVAAGSVAADPAATVPWADFHIPESSHFQKIVIDAQGRVYGHLAEWGKCHEGIEDRCVLAPRPDNYDEYNVDGPLTERGFVGTGPIFFLGGHPDKPIGNGDRWKAYGGVENAWADVRVTNGQIGPWLSGRIRAGISQETLEWARGSRISGHWRRNGSLAAIVSCNAAGYHGGSDPETRAALQLPDSELYADQDGFVIEDGEVVELVASAHHAPEPAIEFHTGGTMIGSITQGGDYAFTTTPNTAPVFQIQMPEGVDPLKIREALGAQISKRLGLKIAPTAAAEIDEDDDEDFLVELALDELDDELPMSDVASNDSH